MNNNCRGQLIGPFIKNTELFYLIQSFYTKPISYINHLGIQTDIENYLYINGKEYEIGKTGVYEIGNTEITSIYFSQDVNENSIIDYTVVFEE